MRMKLSKRTRRLKFSRFIFRICRFVVSLGPLVLFFFSNYDRYVSSLRDVCKLSAGGMIIAIIILLKVLGKLKVPGILVTSTIFMGLCWLFSTVLPDLLLISGIWWGSEVADFILSLITRRLTRKIDICEAADITAQATKAALGGN